MRLEEVLSINGLVQQAPSKEEVEKRVQDLDPNPTRIFYGETYDEHGNAVDSLKYYLYVAMLAQGIQEQGFNVESTILIADTAACRNVSKKMKPVYRELAKERRAFVERVNEVYQTGLRIVHMSDYIDTDEFIEQREGIIDVCRQDEELMQAIEESVPRSKRDIERKKGFLYSFDEVTTIVDLDIKVGPPREDLYDNIARAIAQRRGQKQLYSLFLEPTFPLGMSWAYFFATDGIEEHGITAYKAGSKRLQRNRVLVGKSSPEYVRGLIDQSYLPEQRGLPNPVLDLGIICEMAKQRLGVEHDLTTLADAFYAGQVKPDELRQRVAQDTAKYVLNNFR